MNNPALPKLPSTEELERLKELAKAATSGPWHAPGMGEIHAENHDEIAQILFHTGDDEDMQCGTEADAEYIAAASPDVVLALIERIEALTAVNAAVGAMIKAKGSFHTMQNYAALVAAYDAAMAGEKK